MAAATESCPPVWQYVLTMGNDIRASIASIEQIGLYHYDKASATQMEEIAKYTEQVAEGLRERVEKLTGWEG